MDLAFTQVLANIYMLKWEQDLIRHQELLHEIYGRDTKDQLRTSFYHKPKAEPYRVLYTSDQPFHIHRNIPYTALLYAVCICSHVDDFNSECIRVDVSLLLNDRENKFKQ